LGYFQSGFYYTKALVDARTATRELGNGPWNYMVDLRLEKAFQLTQKNRIAVFLDVKNLFDTENIIAYDNSNSGGNTFELYGDPTGLYERPVSQDGSFFYDIPREIYFGITIDF
jgi:outer membrane receptor for Fe3+-dicitrate